MRDREREGWRGYRSGRVEGIDREVCRGWRGGRDIEREGWRG